MSVAHASSGPETAIGIREATDADLPSIAEIFNVAVVASPYVWMDTPVTLDERRAWLEVHRASGLPVLVATEGDIVIGWASLSVYRPASGYRFTREASVHVAERARRRGVARALVEALLGMARERGVHTIVASIDSENAASISLFERVGFREVARLPEVGRKFGLWRTQLLLLRAVEAAAR